MSKRNDLTGQRFGRLIVIDIDYTKNFKKGLWWICRCDCGKEKSIRSYQLIGNKTNSCGCIRIDRITGLVKIKHGHYKNNTSTKTISVWAGMKQRCHNNKDKNYYRYGGRGIIVCERWLNSFHNFLSDMGEVPFQGAQLDRIDNNGNYEPSNCRWVSCKENQNNRTNSYSKQLQMNCKHILDLNYSFCPLCGMAFGNSLKNIDGSKAGVVNE